MTIQTALLFASLALLHGTETQNPVPSRQTVSLQAIVQSIDVPAGERLLLTATGDGSQIYRCAGTGPQAVWTFVAPEARLWVDGVEIGTHAAGPMWKHRDGSAVWGEVLGKTPSANPDSIPMLLLKVARTEGSGIFSRVNFIQRTDTRGGNAPSDGCDANHIGAELRVPYTAKYLFYSAADPVK